MTITELIYAAIGYFIGMTGSLICFQIKLRQLQSDLDDLREQDSLIRSKLFKMMYWT